MTITAGNDQDVPPLGLNPKVLPGTLQLKEMTNHTAVTTAIVTGMSIDVQYGSARIVRSSSATGKYDFPATSAEVGQVAKGINKSSN